jgi:hypothetical protein
MQDWSELPLAQENIMGNSDHFISLEILEKNNELDIYLSLYCKDKTLLVKKNQLYTFIIL